MKLLDKINYKFFGFQPTFSQCGEDIILKYLFSILKKNTISYIDIGSNHPTKCNNTYLFYRDGSSGICVEPNPNLVKQLRNKRKRDICLNVGVGVNNQSEMDFYIMQPHTLSTFSKRDAEEIASNAGYKIESIIKIPLLSLMRL